MAKVVLNEAEPSLVLGVEVIAVRKSGAIQFWKVPCYLNPRQFVANRVRSTTKTEHGICLEFCWL